MSPKKVDHWNVAELAGGLLLSADDFTVQFDVQEVDKLLAILNSDQDGSVRDIDGNLVEVSKEDREFVVLRRVNDKVYPGGIIVPVKVFAKTEKDDKPIIEGLKPAFFRVGSQIHRGFQKRK